jgi:lysophospholipid acyltransferase (LPLAT)-like uncharacterized protein
MPPEKAPERPPFRAKAIGFLVWAVARMLGRTLRVRRENWDALDRIISEHQGAILVCWHGRTLIPANLLAGRGCWALISLSRDGEIQNQIFRRFGFQTIRGSTGRGGVRAALQLARKVQEGGVLAFTPDGPRGPSHVAQEGTLFLAQRSGRPVVPFCSSAAPCWRVKSWDRYLVPRPFAKASLVVGEPLFAPPEMTEEQKTQWLQQLALAITACEQRADSLAGLTDPASLDNN